MNRKRTINVHKFVTDFIFKTYCLRINMIIKFILTNTFFFCIKNVFYDFREYQESRLPAFSRFRISTPISWFK